MSHLRRHLRLLTATLVASIVLLAPTGPAHAQAPTPPTPPAPLTAAEVNALIEQLASDPSLDEAARVTLKAIYDEALANIGRADELTRVAADFEREIAEAPGRIESIRTELATPPAEPAPEAPPEATLAQVEQLAAEADANLTAARAEVEKLRAEAKRRGERMPSLTEALTAVRRRVAELDEALLAPIEQTPEPRARRVRLRTQRQVVAAELASADAELRSYEARKDLLVARTDRWSRRVTVAEKAVTAWRKVVAARRELEAAKAAAEAERLRVEATRQSPEVQALAERNRVLAALRTGESGTSGRIGAFARERAAMEARLAELRNGVRSVRLKVAAAGLTNAMGLLLRRQLENLPDVAELEDGLDAREETVSDVQFQLVLREEDRADAGDIEQSVAEFLARHGESLDEVARTTTERVVREAFTARRDSLDALINDYQTLFRSLVDLDQAARTLIEESNLHRRWIEERILWVRSVTGRATPQPGDALDGARWLVDPGAWGRGLAAAGRDLLGRWLQIAFGLVLLAGLVVLRLRTTKTMAKGIEALGSPTDQLGSTLVAMLVLALRAATLPAIIWIISAALAAPPGQPAQVAAVAFGLRVVVFVLVPMELIRLTLVPDGPGPTHFGWSSEACSHVRRHLRWFIPLRAVTVLIAVAMDAQEENILWNDALGRIAFVVSVVGLAALLAVILRPGAPITTRAIAAGPKTWFVRLRRLWYPVAIALPLALGAVALRGYYYTALQLLIRLNLTLSLVLGLVVANALFLRWLSLAAARLRREEAAKIAEAEAAAAAAGADNVPTALSGAPLDEGSDDGPAAGKLQWTASGRFVAVGAERPQVDILDVQSRQLFGTAMTIVLIIFGWLIWDDVLPALSRLDRFQVWPELALLDDPSLDDDAALAATLAPAPEPPTSPDGGGGNGGAGSSVSPTAGMIPGGLAAPSEPSILPTPETVTVADLGLTVLILIFTFALAKNVPALLEILVLGRLPLDAGARYAVTTIVRYLFVLIGLPFAFAAVGIHWESVQWLAAALTFGLAFGLQEIFANFISGLIILFERPVRVGDVVTVGETTGTVTRIQMRATTVMDFDRKEKIIPNKTFVTADVVNWVLSDPVLRVVIPVGVAYGSDIARVRRILLRAANDHSEVLAEPEPSAFVMRYGASAIEFDLRVFVGDVNRFVIIRHDLLARITSAFKHAGIEVAFPQLDLHIRSSKIPLTQPPPPSPPPSPDRPREPATGTAPEEPPL